MPESFQILSTEGCTRTDKANRLRLNCLGSLHYFIKVGLRRRRLNGQLHKTMCTQLERDHIKDVFEIPRDHFKSTIASEGFPIWRVLPLNDNDKNSFVKLGYSNDFIEWMERSHKPASRNLLVSENITNASKLGKRISFHYESGALFRGLFPEVIPTAAETWSNFSLQQRIPQSVTRHHTASGGHGEGTFDFLGVQGALQSRHYDGLLIEDDLVGMKAIQSPSIMETTINYHKLVAGAFENEDNAFENDELVIGNRWGYVDLNSHIREHEPWFRVTNHSALGGCCEDHPSDTPIFPEEFSIEKLLRLKERFGNYIFSCQYLNNPCAPEDADFKDSDVRFYEFLVDKDSGEKLIHHEVEEGIIKKDLNTKFLNVCLTTDPNHSGNSGSGRCRHAITVVGLSADGDYYLLDCWAQASNYDTYINKIYELADKWHLTKIGVESIAAQKYLIYHINYRNKLENRYMKIVELKGEVDLGDGVLAKKKEFRIRGILSPLLESRHFYAKRAHQDFLGELTSFPRGKFVDILDSLAYAPQLLKLPQTFMQDLKWRAANSKFARNWRQPYSTGGPS